MKHYLIDGYNYLHRAQLLAGKDLEGARRLLVRRVAPLGGKVTVVWDARHGPQGAGRETVRNVTSIFARSADERILALLRGAADPAACCVVTDDREVAGRARQLRARSLSVGEVERRLSVSAAGDEKPASPRTSAEVREWLEYFGEVDGS